MPRAFVQLNTAVVGYARNERVDGLLKRALAVSHIFQAAGFLDQAMLRFALWHSREVSLYMLPSSWQCRAATDCSANVAQTLISGLTPDGEGVSWQACSILHARGLDNLSLPHHLF